MNAFRAVSAGPTAVEGDKRAPVLALAGAAPNPVAGSATIRFVLPIEGWTRLVLFDAAGKRARTLVDGTLAAGPHLVRWDGRNDRGAPLSSAVYFVRLECGGAVVGKKVVLLDR